jgi:large conductance mechanosensitive channel
LRAFDRPTTEEEHAMGFIQELKDFAAKGNAVDMAVGILVGGAFTKIVNSIVSDLLMPPLGVLIGGVTFTDLKIVLTTKVVDGKEVPDAAILWGKFVNNLIEFGIIVLAAFIVVKMMNKIIAMRIANIPGLDAVMKK